MPTSLGENACPVMQLLRAPAETRSESSSRTVRVVCLLPGLTDIVTELGAAANIVANTHECCNHAAAVTIPKLGADASASLREISAGWSVVSSLGLQLHQDARQCLRNLICSFYSVDVSKLAATKPSVICTILPRQRSFLDPSPEEITNAIKRAIPSVQEVLSIDPSTLSEVFAATVQLSRLLNCPISANMAVAGAKLRLQAIRQCVGKLRTKGDSPRVAILQWADPIYLAGDWVPEIVDVGGGRPGTFTRAGGPSVMLSIQQLLTYDVIVLAVCGVNRKSCRDICKTFCFENREVLKTRRPRIIATDALKLFSRPSLCTVIMSAEVVAEVVSNKAVFDHRGVLWSEFDPAFM